MIRYHTPLDPEVSQAVEAFITAHHSLEKLIGASHPIVSMIQQDEFTSDVVVKYDEDVYLVYDVT